LDILDLWIHYVVLATGLAHPRMDAR